MDRHRPISASTRSRLWVLAASVAGWVAAVSVLFSIGNVAVASAPRPGAKPITTTITPSTTTSVLRASAASPSSTASPAATTSAPSGSGGNLLTGREATFSGTTGGWVGLDSTLSWAKTPSTTNNGSLQMTATASSWVYAWSPFPPSGPPTPAKPGQKFTGDAAVYLTGSPQPMSVGLVFLNSSNAQVGGFLGQSVTPGSSTWTTLPEVAYVAPPSTTEVAVGVVAYSASVGQVFYVESPTLTMLGPGSPVVVGPLHTSGNQVVQANGTPVVLQGVVLEGLEVTPYLNDPGVTQQAVVEAREWGANFVRVPLGEQFWLSSNCDYVSSYQSTVDQVVNWITSLGMVALLDLHTNTVEGCEPGAQQNMADAAQSPTFWSQVAGRYGNSSSPEYNPLVAFDLYNEPHDISDSVWLDGGQTTDTFWPYQTFEAAGMQQLYNAVRGAGSQNLVFISGNNWANDPPSQLVSGTNVVNAVHYYTCPISAPPSCSNPDPYDPSQDFNRWLSLSQTQPIVVTEFGWPSDKDGTYIANVIAFAYAHQWGWSAYAWQQVSNWGGLTFETFLSDGTAEPEPSGVPVLLGLSAG